MTTPLTLTRPAKIHCLARFFGVSGCFRSNQSNRAAVLVSITSPIVRYRRQLKAGIAHYNSPLKARMLSRRSRAKSGGEQGIDQHAGWCSSQSEGAKIACGRKIFFQY